MGKKDAAAEQASRASEEKYRTLFNSIDEGFVIAELLFDDEGKPFDLVVLETNASFERLMRTRTSSVGKRALEIFPAAEASWFEAYGRVVETGEPLRFENYLAPLDAWFELYISRLEGEGSHRFVIVFNETTQRKSAENALRQSEERLRLIIESAKGYAIFTTDADGFINSWNAGAAQIFGWSEAEILGQKADVTFTPEDRAQGEPQKELETARMQGIAPDVRWHQRKDGARVFINGEVRPLYGEQGSGFFKIGRDLTAQRQAEEALREHQRQLQLLNESLEQKVQEKMAEVRQLAAEVIHTAQRERQRISQVLHDDLQQRVFAIQMQMSFLKDGLASENDSARKEASDIERELAEIVKITRTLSINLSPPILPKEGLARAIDWLASRMREQFDLPVELQADGPYIIASESLHILLFNSVRELLFNVVKHARASQVVIRMEASDQQLRIEVQDDGQGIQTEKPEESRSKPDDLPVSLGLPTIRHQLSLFGGSMEIHSKPGAGTQVILIVSLR